MATDNQFSLLKKRRFGPFFLTQFFGAFNDNIFKNALIILIAFQGVELVAADVNTLINLSAGLFILPFFLFSATAGQLADKYEKSVLIRRIKLLEIAIMLAAAVGLYLENISILIGVLFLMGAQSAFFGPVKYGILPQHLRDQELVGGNGMVEMGTFLAILLGTMLGGILIGIVESGALYIAALVIVIACLGYISSRGIPIALSQDPMLRVNWNPITETWRIFQFTRRNRTVFLSILGISWFWFYGATYLTQLPNYTKLTLGGNEQVATLLLTLFAVGISTGSLLCERLSDRKVELGLVPFGSIGLTAFSIDLFFAAPQTATTGLIDAAAFIQIPGSWRVMLDVLLLGMFGGFYIVPLYALVQQRSKPDHRARIIAGNNILNAFLMVLAALMAIVLLNAGFSIPELLLITGILNAFVAVYIYTLVPEFFMRFLVWILIHVVYRMKKNGLDRIPERGPAVLVCNHVSLMDPLVIGGCVRRPVRFVMDYKIYNMFLLNFIFRTARAIPIASAKVDPALLDRAYDQIAEALAAGDLICIFPEGMLTKDGEVNSFRPGIKRIIQRTPVPVIPMALRGLWGSFFSRKYGSPTSSLPRRLWAKIGLLVGDPIAPSHVTVSGLKEKVVELRGEIH